MTESAMVKTLEHGEPSDIPSPSWRWRRVYTFALTALAMALVWRITERLDDIQTLKMVARYLCWIVMGLVFVYVAGATATDCVNMASVLRSTRKVTTSSGPPSATVTEGRVETPDDGELPPWERAK